MYYYESDESHEIITDKSLLGAIQGQAPQIPVLPERRIQRRGNGRGTDRNDHNHGRWEKIQLQSEADAGGYAAGK